MSDFAARSPQWNIVESGPSITAMPKSKTMSLDSPVRKTDDDRKDVSPTERIIISAGAVCIAIGVKTGVKPVQR